MTGKISHGLGPQTCQSRPYSIHVLNLSIYCIKAARLLALPISGNTSFPNLKMVALSQI